MPATFSGRLLLLLLLCTSLSGGSPADPAMTTQDSSQTQVNSMTKMQSGLNESFVSDVTTQDLKPAGKEYNVSEHEIVLSDASDSPLEKIVALPSPAKVELTCKLGENFHLEKPQVTWKRGSETISHTSKARNSWTIELTISDSRQLGSYSCFLKGETEISATFHLRVPKIEGKERPIITYEGDTAVIICKTEFSPKAWTWYMTNGTELVHIAKIFHADKFHIKRPSDSVRRLEILRLTKEDGGVYWCEAAFELGGSKARFELRVLSIMAPLKPFVAIVAEVAILVTTIVLFEVYSKKKQKGGEKEFDQIEQLKSEGDVTGNRK